MIQHLWYFVNTSSDERWNEILHYRRLRDLREDHDLTQDELVAILGMHKTTYTNYEQGKREIPFALVIRLAQFYNVSIDYIAELSNTPSPINGTNIYQRT